MGPHVAKRASRGAGGPDEIMIHPRIDIGHVHLKVSDLERAIAFYSGVLGFELMQRMGTSAAFLSAGGYHHHIGLNTWESQGGNPPPPGNTGLYHFAIRYPDRASLGDALRRLRRGRRGARGRERSWRQRGALSSRPRRQRPRALLGPSARGMAARRRTARLQMVTERARSRARFSRAADAARGRSRPTPGHRRYAPMTEQNRARLRDLRGKLLQLHKVLLDDARAAYEMDRGRVASNASCCSS